MPSVPLYLPRPTRQTTSSSLPSLLNTPLGLALLELQGTIHIPDPEPGTKSTRIGKLVFPDYAPERDADREGPWMKKVWLYVGHQRMLGEVKKLGKPLGVVGRKGVLSGAENGTENSSRGERMDVDEETGTSTERKEEASEETVEELEILEIVRWKIVFSSRPEPFGEDEGDRS